MPDAEPPTQREQRGCGGKTPRFGKYSASLSKKCRVLKGSLEAFFVERHQFRNRLHNPIGAIGFSQRVAR